MTAHHQPQPNPIPTPSPRQPRTLAIKAAKIVVFGTLGAIAMAAPVVASAVGDDDGERGPHHACWEDLLDAAETDAEEHEAFETALADCGIPLFGRTWRVTID